MKNISVKGKQTNRRCTLQLWYLICDKFYRRSKKQFGNVCI